MGTKPTEDQVIGDLLKVLSGEKQYKTPGMFTEHWIRADNPPYDTIFSAVHQLMAISPDGRDELFVLVARLVKEDSGLVEVQYFKDSNGRSAISGSQLEPTAHYMIAPPSFQGKVQISDGDLGVFNGKCIEVMKELSPSLGEYIGHQAPVHGYLHAVVDTILRTGFPFRRIAREMK